MLLYPFASRSCELSAVNQASGRAFRMSGILLWPDLSPSGLRQGFPIAQTMVDLLLRTLQRLTFAFWNQGPVYPADPDRSRFRL